MNKLAPFTRQHRLVNKAEFQALFDQAKKIIYKNNVLLFKKNQMPFARLGIIVGKKTAKRAVMRNRIKRVIRESFRCNQDRLQKVDVLIIARKSSDRLNKQKLREGIDLLWKTLIA